MGTKDHHGMAKLDPMGTVGRIYVGAGLLDIVTYY